MINSQWIKTGRKIGNAKFIGTQNFEQQFFFKYNQFLNNV